MPIFSLPIRVYIEDTDVGGIVYHANYLKYMERARTECLRSAGYGRHSLQGMGIMFVVNSIDIHYLAPAKLDDALIVTMRLIKFKRVSALLQQEVYSAKDSASFEKPVSSEVPKSYEKKLCEAKVNIVCVDRFTLKPRTFEDIKAALMDYADMNYDDV